MPRQQETWWLRRATQRWKWSLPCIPSHQRQGDAPRRSSWRGLRPPDYAFDNVCAALDGASILLFWGVLDGSWKCMCMRMCFQQLCSPTQMQAPGPGNKQ